MFLLDECSRERVTLVHPAFHASDDRGRDATEHVRWTSYVPIRPSTAPMPSRHFWKDIAMAESFFASLETELIDRSSWRTPDEARAAVFEWIGTFYNRRRRHSALGCLSPEAFEARYRIASAAA